MMRVENHPDAGFTLMEILVSLLVVAIVFGSLFQHFSASSLLMAKGDEVAKAAHLAQKLLNDGVTIRDALSRDTAEGAIEGEKDWSYEIQVSPLEIPVDPEKPPLEMPGIKDLQLCIVHHRGDRSKKWCLRRWYPN